MPFCSICGSQVEDGFRFCNYCGSPIAVPASSSSYAPPNGSNQNAQSPYEPPYGAYSSNQNAVSPYAPPYVAHGASQSAYSPYAQQGYMLKQQELVRKDSLSEMNRMIDYFSQKQEQYDEYDKCIAESERLSKPNAYVKAQLGPDGNVFFVLGMVFTGIITAIGVILITLTASRSFSAYFRTWGWGAILLMAGVLSLSLSSLVYGAKCKGRNNRIMRDTRLRCQRENQERFEKLAQELYQHYENYGYCPTSPSYTNPKILAKIRENIWDGRADTIKESINLLHQDAHNSEMELQAQLTARAAELSARASASAARSARTAAFFTAANFFLK